MNLGFHFSLLPTLSFFSLVIFFNAHTSFHSRGYPLAALARLYDHVGQLFNFGCFANVVEDGERFQILRHTAWRSRSFWIYGVIQAEHLEDERKKKRLRQLLSTPSCHCRTNSPYSAWKKAHWKQYEDSWILVFFNASPVPIWCHSLPGFPKVLSIQS